MTKSPFSYLPNMPVALAGVALGTAGITGAWTSVTNQPSIAIIGAGIALILASTVALKYILYPSTFLEEIACPTLGSVIPTMAMAFMLIASIVVSFSPLIGKIIWITAILCHAVFLITFFIHRAKDFNIEHIIPSWFVPPIGLVVGAVSGSEMGFPFVSEALFYFGLFAYLILLPLIFYRVLFCDRIEDKRLPSFGIMGAPANLCLAGYLTAFAEPNYYLATGLAYLGIFTTSLVYLSMIKVFRIPFFPLYAAYTFPLAIGSTAIIKYTSYLKTTTTPDSAISVWQNIAYIELVIASIVILYVFINLKRFIWKNIIKKAS